MSHQETPPLLNNETIKNLLPSITVEKLSLQSGLQVFVVYTPNRTTTSVGALINFGSRHEKYYDLPNGTAHFIEHMLFNGSAKYSKKQISNIIEGNGGYYNAFTTPEYTFYYASILSSSLWLCIDIFIDMLTHPYFKVSEFKKEKNVIMEEIKSHDDIPDDYLSNKFDKHFWGNGSLSYPIAGDINSIKSISLSNLKDLFNQFYIPNNISIIILSHITPTNIIKTLLNNYDTHMINQSSHNNQPLMLEEPQPIDAQQQNFWYKEDKQQEHVWIQLGHAASSYASLYEYCCMTIFNTIIGGNSSSILHKILREEMGAVYNIYSCYSAFHDTGILQIGFSTNIIKYHDCLANIKAVLYDLNSHCSYDMFCIAKNYILGHLLMGLDNNNFIMKLIGDIIQRKRNVFNIYELLDTYNMVSFEDIQILATKFKDWNNWKGAMIGPFNDNPN